MDEKDYAAVRCALQVLTKVLAEEAGVAGDKLATAIKRATPPNAPLANHLCAAMADTARTGNIKDPTIHFKPGDPF